jgi:hypothetical protein
MSATGGATGAECPNCGKDAVMVRGRCTNCGFVRDTSIRGLPARYVRGNSLSDDLDRFFWVALWIAPAVVLLVLGLVLALDVLLIIGVAIFVVPLVVKAALDWL